MAKPLSFNKWITSDLRPLELQSLTDAWVTTRGRLTRASVVARAVQEYGCTPQLAHAAWDAYQTYLASLTSNPKDNNPC